MTWKGFFEGIGNLFENVLFIPLDALRDLELSSWWAANALNWVFLLIGFVAFFYWMRQINKSGKEGTEDRSVTSHSYLN